MTRHFRVLLFSAILLLAGGSFDLAPLEGQQPKSVSKVMYVLPNNLSYAGLSEAQIVAQAADLRQRLGEGRYVRVGFTVYVGFDMNEASVDINDAAAMRGAIAPAVAQIDSAIAKARAANIPICLSILTAIRQNYDDLQRDAERIDRRSTMWYMDGGLAPGWVTHSRYARRFRRRYEAYVRALGAVLANRMARFPGTLVAASGDGEVEMSPDRSPIRDPVTYNEQNAQLNDYSPFAVAEFRDWLRNGGLYAQGQLFAGQGYEHAARYQGDATPGTDTNGDGRTLNGDFGTSFGTWDLRHFDWSLTDQIENDPGAIPSFVYNSPSFNPLPAGSPGGFDAPRVRATGHPWWDTWNLFRQVMIWRSNVEFAKWITTTVDTETKVTVPFTRWFSHQIAADYLFGTSPEAPNYRLITGASPHWTADVTPYGGFGITSFNVQIAPETYASTSVVFPVIAARQVRWGLLEWNPSIPVSNSLGVYEHEMALIEQYRPTLIVPFAWGDPTWQIQNTPFEVALRDLISRIKDGPSSAPRATLRAIGQRADPGPRPLPARPAINWPDRQRIRR